MCWILHPSLVVGGLCRWPVAGVRGVGATLRDEGRWSRGEVKAVQGDGGA